MIKYKQIKPHSRDNYVPVNHGSTDSTQLRMSTRVKELKSVQIHIHMYNYTNYSSITRNDI